MRGTGSRLARAVLSHDIVLGLAAILIVAFGARGLTDYHVYVVTIVVIFSIVGASHVVLFGAAGQPSLGHAALLGAGAYAAITVANHIRVDVVLELLGAMLVGALLGAFVGLPSLRIGSLYLAIATLALSVVGQQVFYLWTGVTGGGAGIGVPPMRIFGHGLDAMGLLYVALAFAGISFVLARNLLKGRTGRAWNAVRTSPIAASSVGIASGRQKVAAFAVSGALVGGAGVLYAHAVNYMAPENFSVELSIITIVIAVVGGQRYLWGAVLGAFFVEGVPEFLRALGEWRDTIYGAVFIGVMLFFPEGFAGGVKAASTRVRSARRTRPEAAPPETVAFAENGNPGHGGEGRSRVATAIQATASGEGAANRDRAASGGARLEIDEVRVVFGGVQAVGGVTIAVEPRSVVGLVGPNGAGKTTLLNAISGFVRPTSGSIAVDGRQILRRGSQHRAALGVARTFQNLSLHHGLTVADHVLIGQHSHAAYGALSQSLRLPPFRHGEARMRRHGSNVLTALELEHFADEVVENLPYGIQKRVDVARALASSPRLLLLDEPAAGLTAEEGNDLVHRVLALAEQTGMTVVLVEHNIDLVMRVADRIVALNFGTVVADDVPSQVRVHEEFVRSYLGA